MLISFTLGNWRSFRDKTTLSMVPTSERRFGWTLSSFSNAPKKLLPIAAIYGANASGKTNFFKGLSFLADFIIHGVEAGNPIPVEPNRIDSNADKEPTYFCIILRAEDKVYKYSLEIDQEKIIFEQLSKIVSKEKEIVLFERKSNKNFIISPSLADQRINFVYEGTQDNLLFLTNAFRQKVEFVAPIYNWFKYQLIFIGTESIYGSQEIFRNNCAFQKKIGQYLSRYDTGITGIKSKQIHLEKPLGKFEDGEVITGQHGERLLVTKDKTGTKINILNSLHTSKTGEEVSFDFREESDGTKRLLDLLPSLILCEDYPDTGQIFIIDEIDRSLHQNLIFQLITEYLNSCSNKTRHQLIMTTHDTGLMNQALLRRDEMWVIDHNDNGAFLQSISEFKNIRFDTVLDKLYLDGRFGGVPKLLTYALPVFKRNS